MHSLAISRDGGILDWDDLVSDVLDDREQVIPTESFKSKDIFETYSPPAGTVND